MEGYFRKRFYILCGIILISLGCVGPQIKSLEKRVSNLETVLGTGVSSSAFTAHGFYGGGTGDCDAITSTGDGDRCFVVLHDDSDLGDALIVYVLDVDSACGGDDTSIPPLYFQAADGGDECWELANYSAGEVWGKMKISKQAGATVTVGNFPSGTYFINDDNDVITFNLPANPTDLIYCFGNDTDSTAAITIDCDASDYIVLDGTAASQGEAVVSAGSSAEEGACVIGLDASYWKVTGYTGTWAQETP